LAAVAVAGGCDRIRHRVHPGVPFQARPVSHPANELDDVVHQRVRLGILAVLNEAPKSDFAYLRSTLSLTDGNLSRHLTVLEDAGYVVIEKEFVGKKPRTYVTATKAGKVAFNNEVASLQKLLDGLRGEES
jgi:DNA-binding MarR family transcriptional regulator